MPSIVSIAYSPPTEIPRPLDRYHRAPAAEAMLVADRGIESDRKSKGGDRQLNIMSAATLEQLRNEGFHTAPGQMGEQLVLEGLDVDNLPAGSKIKLGPSAVVEVMIPRTGCDRFEHIQGKLKRLVRGRLGVMARVKASGKITVGDAVSVIE
jgi:MOSC domain-containing protein YiiM